MPDLHPVTRTIARLAALEQRTARSALRAWGAARPALLTALDAPGPSQALTIGAAIRQVAGQVRQAIGGAADAIAPIVTDQVARQTGRTPPTLVVAATALGLVDWEAATLGLFLTALTRLQAGGADRAGLIARLISGDGRISVHRQAAIGLQLAVESGVWAIAGGHTVRLADAMRVRDGVVFQKQAIAAIDSRTTRCCLAVHGQIQELDAPFVLRDTPRYADRVQNPPFHWRCRTAVSLYTPAMEAIGPSTAAMRAHAARALAESSPSRTR